MKKLFSASERIWLEPGMAMVRVIVGLFMVYHGWEIFNAQKMADYTKWLTDLAFPLPAVMAAIGKLCELVSGLLLTVGLFTRLAVFPLMATMLGICFAMGKGRVFYEDQHPFLFVLLGLVFFFYGSGKYSLDHTFFSGHKAG